LRWPGGAVAAFLGFIPNIFAYFLVCLHCNTRKKLKVLVLMLFCVSAFAIARGAWDLQFGASHNYTSTAGLPLGDLDQTKLAENRVMAIWDYYHPYLLAQRNDDGVWFFRLRGLGDVNDPNDFAQVIVCLVPLMFIFWEPKKHLQNFVRVILPNAVLLFGDVLTHSRGSLVALLTMVVVTARRKIGTLPAALAAGGIYAAATALHFAGGREISAEAGSDRTSFWGEGLELLKQQPIFGVGFGNFKNMCGCGHTAHNSIVVCAAELGLFGMFFWCVFLFSSARDAWAIASPAMVSDEKAIDPVSEFPGAAPIIDAGIDKAEINRLGRLVVLSLMGFLVAGLFLSRAYVMTLFLLGGVAEVVYEMALRRQMISPRLRMEKVLMYSAGLVVLFVLAMYVLIRILNLMR